MQIKVNFNYKKVLVINSRIEWIYESLIANSCDFYIYIYIRCNFISFEVSYNHIKFKLLLSSSIYLFGFFFFFQSILTSDRSKNNFLGYGWASGWDPSQWYIFFSIYINIMIESRTICLRDLSAFHLDQHLVGYFKYLYRSQK